MPIDQSQYELCPAASADLPQIAALLPALADFEVPQRRNPDHLWQGDLKMVEDVLAGRDIPSFCDVLKTRTQGTVHGLILVTLRPEPLSAEPSAHLEAIAVHADARGGGLGRALLAHAESRAKAKGAGSMTLHVFANNQRARALYAAADYDEELIRCMKWL